MSFNALLSSLQDLRDIEDSARASYIELFDKLEDKRLRQALRSLIDAEKRHKKLIEEAIDIIRDASYG
jgi:rubrerythrin